MPDKQIEEMIEEIKAWAGELQHQNYVVGGGRALGGQEATERLEVCHWCGANADKLVEHFREKLHAAKQAGREEENKRWIKSIKENGTQDEYGAWTYHCYLADLNDNRES